VESKVKNLWIALTAFRFHNVRTVGSSLKIPRSTICDHLQIRNLTVKHLRWVPHTLDECTKRARVERANSMLKMMTEAGHQTWWFLLTGGEVSFFYSTDDE
jgi:hypothetical protein